METVAFSSVTALKSQSGKEAGVEEDGGNGNLEQKWQGESRDSGELEELSRSRGGFCLLHP